MCVCVWVCVCVCVYVCVCVCVCYLCVCMCIFVCNQCHALEKEKKEKKEKVMLAVKSLVELQELKLIDSLRNKRNRSKHDKSKFEKANRTYIESRNTRKEQKRKKETSVLPVFDESAESLSPTSLVSDDAAVIATPKENQERGAVSIEKLTEWTIRHFMGDYSDPEMTCAAICSKDTAIFEKLTGMGGYMERYLLETLGTNPSEEEKHTVVLKIQAALKALPTGTKPPRYSDHTDRTKYVCSSRLSVSQWWSGNNGAYCEKSAKG